MIAALSNCFPKHCFPKQLVDDIKESESIVVDPSGERTFLALLVLFLNDFCHVCLQYTCGIDDLLEQGQQSEEAKLLLKQRKGQAESVNSYIQLFCKFLQETEIVKPRVLLYIVQKYIPASLVEGAGIQNVGVVLDQLQTSLLNAIPDLQGVQEQHGAELQLSDLWLRFTEESERMVEADKIEQLWMSLCHAVQTSHAVCKQFAAA
jgi:hypothetical protein